MRSKGSPGIAPEVDQRAIPIAPPEQAQPVTMSLPKKEKKIQDAGVVAMRDALKSMVIKKTTPAQIQMQRTFINSANETLREIQPNFNVIAKYAGLAMKSKLPFEKYAASVGLQPDNKDYQIVRNFLEVQRPALANEIRRAFAGQASDTEIKSMLRLVDPLAWGSNPAAAVSHMNSLVGMLTAISKALTQSQAQTAESLKTNINNPVVFGAPQTKGAFPNVDMSAVNAELARRKKGGK